MNKREVSEALIGSRARFVFNGKEACGEIVGVKSKNSLWFLADNGFDVPIYWSMSNECPGAFATDAEFLHDICPPRCEETDIQIDETAWETMLFGV